MDLHADLSRRGIVHARHLAWTPSPAAGVERRMLFRRGGEQAVATSIVRYAPGSAFPRHTHPGGEEFLVLDGVFEDENGHYPVGSYVRNPPGSAHSAGSKPGCTIFVRLRQFAPDDTRHVVVPPADLNCAVSPFGARLLFDAAGEQVAIVHWPANSSVELPAHGGMEALVLEGGLHAFSDTLECWSWIRLPPHEPLSARAGSAGCTAWVKAKAPILRASSANATSKGQDDTHNPNTGLFA